jgi:NAD(P)-dependent dehydrogenase (short-subunit alcohol dehydrogenase family)
VHSSKLAASLAGYDSNVNKSSDHQKTSTTDRGTVICIGTSGMLASCTRRLIKDGWHVHAIARDQTKLDQLCAGSEGFLTTAASDYRKTKEFERELDEAPEPVTAVLYWIHSDGQEAIDLIENRYSKIDRCRVVGSAHRMVDSDETSSRIVQLGFVIEETGSRWLTHDEISDGTYQGFVSGDQRTLVGTLEPWSSRP